MRNSSNCSTLVLVVVVVATSTTTTVICFVSRTKAFLLNTKQPTVFLLNTKHTTASLSPEYKAHKQCALCSGERLAVMCFVSRRKADSRALCVQEKG